MLEKNMSRQQYSHIISTRKFELALFKESQWVTEKVCERNDRRITDLLSGRYLICSIQVRR